MLVNLLDNLMDHNQVYINQLEIASIFYMPIRVELNNVILQ